MSFLWDLLSHEPLLRLGFSESAQCFQKIEHEAFRKVALYDVCSGMGGFTVGAQPLGIDTIAFLECNALACDHPRANFKGPVFPRKC